MPAAIWYESDGYRPQGRPLMGRRVAGEGFLDAYARYGRTERFTALVRDPRRWRRVHRNHQGAAPRGARHNAPADAHGRGRRHWLSLFPWSDQPGAPLAAALFCTPHMEPVRRHPHDFVAAGDEDHRRLADGTVGALGRDRLYLECGENRRATHPRRTSEPITATARRDPLPGSAIARHSARGRLRKASDDHARSAAGAGDPRYRG